MTAVGLPAPVITHLKESHMSRRPTAIAALVVLAAALTGCGSSGSVPAPVVTAPAESPAAPADDVFGDEDTADLTEAVVDLTWSQTSATDREAMCTGIDMLGPDWAAEQLADGGGDVDGLDWDLAAELIAAKCDEL